MAGSRETEWETELGVLRERYRSHLSRDLEALDALLREARTASSALGEAHQLAHRLKGSSGSYGLRRSSEALEEIEARLADLLGDPPDPGSAWDEIEGSLLRARAGLDEQPSSGAS